MEELTIIITCNRCIITSHNCTWSINYRNVIFFFQYYIVFYYNEIQCMINYTYGLVQCFEWFFTAPITSNIITSTRNIPVSIITVTNFEFYLIITNTCTVTMVCFKSQDIFFFHITKDLITNNSCTVIMVSF